MLGLKFQFTVRGQLVKKPKFDLALRFDPGLLLYFPSSTTVVGMTFPVGLEFELPDHLSLPGERQLRPALLGHLPAPRRSRATSRSCSAAGSSTCSSTISRSPRVFKMGPTIATGSRTRNAFFTLYFLVGMAYRF